MAFIHFKNTPVYINGNLLLINGADLSQEIELDSQIKSEERVSDRYLPKSSYAGRLGIRYFVTGQDYLKQFLAQPEDSPLTGVISDLRFIQGYLTSYNVQFSPNQPIEVSAEINFYDKLSGTFAIQPQLSNTGKILNLSNITLQNLSNYTTNTLSNITQASFNYSCEVTPYYDITDSGNLDELNHAQRVKIGRKNISMEVTSDSTNMDLPISGENFALIISGRHPFYNTTEDWACSGKISSKSLSLNAGAPHSHQLKIEQSHLNIQGGISGIITGANTFTVYSTNDNSHPFTSRDNSLQYIDRIFLGDTQCPNFTIVKNSTYDQINVTKPYDLLNDTLSIYGTHNNFITNSPVVFDYSGITVNDLLIQSGRGGTPYLISGDNFYRISEVSFGGVRGAFKVLNPRQLQAIVPYDGVTNKLKIIAGRRNITGTSSNLFFCEPKITTVSPVTGIWSGTITLGGLNFSGVTGVLFGTGVPAFSFSLTSNVLMSVTTPLTGAGFPTGYITIGTSGGITKSLSRYNPHLPVYGISPASGLWNSPVTIYTKWDRDYLSISGQRVNQLDGFKVRFGNIDTAFYISGGVSNLPYTGAITGLVPVGAIDDYVYLYQPNGTDTYTPYTGTYNCISEPVIYSTSPSYINQYGKFNATLYGQNFKYFFGQPFFFALSGGRDNDVHKYTNIMSNSGGAADTLQVLSLNITGNTGIYHAIVKNFAGAAVLTGALIVFSGINKARFQPGCQVTTPGESFLESFNSVDVNFANDGNTGVNLHQITSKNGDVTEIYRDDIAAVRATTTLGEKYFQIQPKNNNVIDISLIRIYMAGNYHVYTANGNTFTANPSGGVQLYYKNAASPVIDSFQINISGVNGIFISGMDVTGIRTIRIYSPKVAANNTEYVGIKELEIY